MKQCTNCGAWNAPNSAFCQNCGKPFPVVGQTKSEALFVQIKRACASPVYLAATILYTFYAVFVMVAAVVDWPAYLFAYHVDLPFSFLTVFPLIQYFAGTLPAVLPALLITIGLWVFYGACRSSADRPASTGGLTTLKASSILSIIWTGLGLLLLLILAPFFFIFAVPELGDESAIVAISAIVVLLAANVPQIVYHARILHSLSVAHHAVSRGICTSRLSVFVIVWNIILAFSNLLTLISFFLRGFSQGTLFSFYDPLRDIIDLLLPLTGMLFYIFISVSMISCRSQMKRLFPPINATPPVVPISPAYPQPPYLPR